MVLFDATLQSTYAAARLDHGALIALYFALESQGPYKDSAVWMLDPAWFNHEVLNEVDENNYVEGILLPHWKEADPWFPEPFEEVLHVTYPVAIDPPHVARRVSVQRSRFTVHGRSKRGLESFVVGMPKLRLVKFVIANRVGKQILDHLSTFNPSSPVGARTIANSK